MARTLEALASDWKETSDHERMTLSLITWEARHKSKDSYSSEVRALSQTDAKILYQGFLALSRTNNPLFFQLMTISQGRKL
jgi:hypothetical protein